MNHLPRQVSPAEIADSKRVSEQQGAGARLLKRQFLIKSMRGRSEGFEAWYDEQRAIEAGTDRVTVTCPFASGSVAEKNFWAAYHEMEQAEDRLCDICGLPLKTTARGVECMQRGCGGHIVAKTILKGGAS